MKFPILLLAVLLMYTVLLGAELLESAYRECLYYDLHEKGLLVVKEKPMPIIYKDVKPDHSCRMDLLVENKVVIELKTVEAINEVHIAHLFKAWRLSPWLDN